MRRKCRSVLGWLQGSSKLATLLCGQPLANGNCCPVSMASCHKPHGVNGKEMGTGGWQKSRMQPFLAENQGGGKNTPCTREIMPVPKTVIPKFKKKKRFFNQTVLLSLGSEWKIVHTAKLATEARPVKTICRQHSSK